MRGVQVWESGKRAQRTLISKITYASGHAPAEAEPSADAPAAPEGAGDACADLVGGLDLAADPAQRAPSPQQMAPHGLCGVAQGAAATAITAAGGDDATGAIDLSASSAILSGAAAGWPYKLHLPGGAGGATVAPEAHSTPAAHIDM